MAFKIIRADIAKVKADAIVNTANPDVAIGAGVDAAIYAAAGEDELLAARREIGVLEPGEVGITKAFRLPAKYIIHSSGPWYEDGTRGETDVLKQCYNKSLMLAYEYGCKSIAFPLMATGTYGFPEELGLQIATAAFTEFLMKYEMDITLVVFGSSAYKISGRLLERIETFIDDEGNSLENNRKAIYQMSFSEYLQSLIADKGMKNSEIYARANISKQYFSKLLGGQVNPSKSKMLALTLGLCLDTDEAVEFLQTAGYAFSPIDQTDRIVQYFLRKKEYSVIKINIVLFDYGLPCLSER